MSELINKLSNSIIVSCQSEGDDPFNESPEYMALFARAAVMGGAMGIRTQGIRKINAIKSCVSVPIIGLLKSTFEDGTVRITGSFNEVEALIESHCDIIAVDGTYRLREGLTGPEFIRKIKEVYSKVVILADIATIDEAIACERAGADAVSTTLNGYTPNTLQDQSGPNFKLLKQCISSLNIPVFAEGRYNTPIEAKQAMELGAHAVISGTAITRPRVITSWFVEAINQIKYNHE